MLSSTAGARLVVQYIAYPDEGQMHVNGICVMSGGGAGINCARASGGVRVKASKGTCYRGESSSLGICCGVAWEGISFLLVCHARPLTSATLLGRVSASAVEEVNPYSSLACHTLVQPC